MSHEQYEYAQSLLDGVDSLCTERQGRTQAQPCRGDSPTSRAHATCIRLELDANTTPSTTKRPPKPRTYYIHRTRC